jgi:DNA-binding NarL/FixJ family response regulator
MDKISVLVADDHPMFRHGIRALLNSLDDMQVVGEAESGHEARAQAETLQPDVILMDIQMPGLNGIEATRQIHQTSPHIAILILTMFEDDDSVFAAMQAGARGYLLKGANHEQIINAIRTAAEGGAIFSPAIAQRMMNYFSAPKPTASLAFPELTAREREVLELLALGYNNGEIAQKLVLSDKTVRNHVSNIFNKLEVSDRAQAILRARDAGMGHA